MKENEVKTIEEVREVFFNQLEEQIDKALFKGKDSLNVKSEFYLTFDENTQRTMELTFELDLSDPIYPKVVSGDVDFK